ncbi:hypothetical protein [Streptomyces noursei]|uniref:hypothetical protein n=1 Tax=Streptomyces noursei TaxID=1971 RepID=UPI00167BC525|nr:hypothetical protein [Streptomyces noursei]MCZ1014007.1 hypothetical protein [Streptomyces noursei]GGX49137.1 hypothetical protein GCM10010341_83470 [Streptomyces noursei]
MDPMDVPTEVTADRERIIAVAIAHLESGKSTAVSPEGALRSLRRSQQDAGDVRQFGAYKSAQRILQRDGLRAT